MVDLFCSIVVRAYNEEKHIGRLFSGLNQQNNRNFEVVLVDSGSRDDTLGIIENGDWDFPVRILHIKPQQFTFGRSLNHGIKHTRSEFVVIASAHIYPVYPDWIERLVSVFSDENIGLVYGKQRGGETTSFSEHQIFSRWFPMGSRIQTSNPFCNNANAAIRKKLWLEHNYEESLSGLEDLEWAHWAIDQGYYVAYLAEAEIVHIHEDHPKGIYNRYRREAMAFKRIFPQERFSFFDFIKLYVSNAITDSVAAVREGKFFDAFGSILWFRLMQFWGTYRGYKQSGQLTQELRQTFYYPGGSPSILVPETRNVKPIQYEDL